MEDNEQKVKCNNCEWSGVVGDLIIKEDIEHCPKCDKDDCLMDKEQ